MHVRMHHMSMHKTNSRFGTLLANLKVGSMYVYMHACMYASYDHAHDKLKVWTHEFKGSLYVCMYVCVYVYMFVCMVFVYRFYQTDVFTYIHTQTHTRIIDTPLIHLFGSHTYIHTYIHTHTHIAKLVLTCI